MRCLGWAAFPGCEGRYGGETFCLASSLAGVEMVHGVDGVQ